MYLLGGIMHICIEYMYACPSLPGMIPNGFKIFRFSSVLKSTKGSCTVLCDKKYQVSLFLQCYVLFIAMLNSERAWQLARLSMSSCVFYMFFSRSQGPRREPRVPISWWSPSAAKSQQNLSPMSFWAWYHKDRKFSNCVVSFHRLLACQQLTNPRLLMLDLLGIVTVKL